MSKFSTAAADDADELQNADIAELRLTLIANGYVPIPAKGKGPHFRGWSRFRPKPNQIEGQIRNYGDHTNTGILCGEVVAIDIDVLDEPAAAIIRQMVLAVPSADKALERIGRSPKSTFIFRAATSRRKITTGKYKLNGHDAQVEILGVGQQFVAFGIHPDTGQEYRWVGSSPRDVALADLPEITPETIDAFVAEVDIFLASLGPPVTKKAKAASPQPAGGTFWQRVNTAALASPDKWVKELFPSARKEAGTGAWRVSSADLGRALEEDLSIHPDGIRDFGSEKPATAIQLVLDYGGAPTPKDAAHWLCERLGIDPAELGWKYEPIFPPQAANDNEPDWRKAEADLFRSDSTLSDLTRPGGYLEELIDWIVSSAEHPSRELALSAVIPFVGALIGRRFAGYRDARSNIYSIALASSGYGKDHARQQLKRLIASENLHAFTGPARLMSASGLRNALMAKPSMNCMIDEVGGLFREILDPRGGDHKKTIKNDLLEYFSTASTYFDGAAYAVSPAIKLEQPNLCIYGTSTPDDFWNAMSSLAMFDGFMARLLLFNVEGRKPELVVPTRDVKDIPPGIRATARALAMAGRVASLDVPGCDSGEKARVAHDVPLSAEAERRRLEFKRDIDRKLEKATGSDATVLNRAVEHAVKLALIVAVATDWENPEVNERHMSWAIQVAWLSCVALMREARMNVAEGQRERNVNRVLRLIMDSGERGITRGALVDRFRNIPRRERDEILADLTQSGRVGLKERPSGKAGGRPTTVLYAT